MLSFLTQANHSLRLYVSTTLATQLRPVLQPLADFALETAVGRIVKALPTQRFREVVLSRKGFRRVVIVFVA